MRNYIIGKISPRYYPPWQKPYRGAILNKLHPLSRGLVGCWLFNELGGTRQFDYGEGGYDLEFQGSPFWNVDTIEFGGEGSGDFLESVLHGGLSKAYIPDNITLVCRIYGYTWNNVEGDNNMIFGLADDITVAGVEFGVTEGAGARDMCIAYYDTAVRGWYEATNTNLAINTWYSLAFVRDKDNGQFHAYVDGKFIQSISTTTGSITYDDDVILVGYQVQNVEFEGLIQYVYYYNRVLTADEISWLHREPYCMFTQPRRIYITDRTLKSGRILRGRPG